MASPASVRFDESVLKRLRAFVSSHAGHTLSSAANALVDESLRSQAHPMVFFWDGPAGRRARLHGGPDVWEVVRAVRSTREVEPNLTADEIVELVHENHGVEPTAVRAALSYWAEFPAEVDEFITSAEETEERLHAAWCKQQALLTG